MSEPTLQQCRDAVAELCLLQYGSDPKNVDAVIVKYAKMRAERIALDNELVGGNRCSGADYHLPSCGGLCGE